MTAARGFTLLEMVAVMLILSIVAVGGVSLVQLAIDSYQQQRQTHAAVNQSRFVLERISRELQTAVVGSVRLSCDPADNGCGTQRPQCLEWTRQWAAGRYVIGLPPVWGRGMGLISAPSDYGFQAGDRLVMGPGVNTDYYSDQPTSPEMASWQQDWFGSPGVAGVVFERGQGVPAGYESQPYAVVRDPTTVCSENGQIVFYDGYGRHPQFVHPAQRGSVGHVIADSQAISAPFSLTTGDKTSTVDVRLSFDPTGDSVFNRQVVLPHAQTSTR